ncbi:MAG: 4Fe-4S binding protein [Holosporales bacterium]|nr:4Fe-4S binding protein [Holosporales bacterium]
MIKRFLKNALLIDILKALFIGLKCCFKKPVTRDLKGIQRSDKFRKILTYDSDKCVGCRMCSEVCPCHAILINAPGKHTYDPKKCCYCGLCHSACKFGALYSKTLPIKGNCSAR